MPMVASVFTTIQINAVRVLLSWATGRGFSGPCSDGNNPVLSTSSPISNSSGDFSFVKLPSVELLFSLSSNASASVIEELTEGARSVDRSAMVKELMNSKRETDDCK